jgi:hypothetical protein
MRVEALPVYVWRVAVTGDLVHHPDVLYSSDLTEVEVRADHTFHRHVDGEPLPSARVARFGIAHDVLKVQA